MTAGVDETGVPVEGPDGQLRPNPAEEAILALLDPTPVEAVLAARGWLPKQPDPKTD